MQQCTMCNLILDDRPGALNSYLCPATGGKLPHDMRHQSSMVNPGHYKNLKIEPWDYILANGIGYMEGSAIKYLSRWKEKGGVVDLQKAKAFIERLIEEQVQKEAAKFTGSRS